MRTKRLQVQEGAKSLINKKCLVSLEVSKTSKIWMPPLCFDNQIIKMRLQVCNMIVGVLKFLLDETTLLVSEVLSECY